MVLFNGCVFRKRLRTAALTNFTFRLFSWKWINRLEIRKAHPQYHAMRLV